MTANAAGGGRCARPARLNILRTVCALLILSFSGASGQRPDDLLSTVASGPGANPTNADKPSGLSDASQTTSASAATGVNATAAATASPRTTVVSIFYLDERAFEGLPYTMFHRGSGAVLGVDDDSKATTFAITTTRVDQRPRPTHSRTDNITTGIVTLKGERPGSGPPQRGQASTITQGPETFEFTGVRYGGPDHTIVNRCSLNGTVSATCNLTHVGSVWYARSGSDWDGRLSTYNYSWRSGDRFGFAPVTITQGVELMKGPANPTGSAAPERSSNAAAAPARGRGMRRGSDGEGVFFYGYGVRCSVAMTALFVVGVFVVL